MTTAGRAQPAGEPVVVIGAGFAGLSAAVRLAGAGRKVVLFEATKGGGGRSRSFMHEQSGCELDNGQHLMMGCYRETLSFLREIGSHGGVHTPERQGRPPQSVSAVQAPPGATAGGSNMLM